MGHHKLPIYAWAIPGEPAAQAWALAFCRALGRQRPRAGEPKGLRVSCVLDPDPRRAALLVQVVGTEEPLAALENRWERLLRGTDRPQLQASAREVASELRFAGHHPIGLARQLAALADNGEPGRRWELDRVSGAASLAGDAEEGLAAGFPALLSVRNAIVLVRPGQEATADAGAEKPAPAPQDMTQETGTDEPTGPAEEENR